MKCPECGGAELVLGVKEVPFTYKGRTIMLETHADFCPVCGEGVLSDEEADRLDGLSEVFRRKVNEELFDPAFVLSVRKKLGLDQRQAGELFGGGANAFSRYELGKAKPPQALVQLFKLLNNDPSRLNELRG